VRRSVVLLAVLGSLGLIAVPAVAGFLATPPTEISINDNFFEPSTPPAQDFHSGASFHWQRAVNSVGIHDVVQDAKLFKSGDPTTDPIDFSVNASAGTYHYYCSVHGSPGGSPMDGMNGILKVAPLQTGPLTVNQFDTFGVMWADANTTTGSLYDVRYRIGSGHWTMWLNDTPKTHATFGKNKKPAKVVRGKTYNVSVRSEKTNTAKRSGWSPPMSYTLTGP
jgi:plastocyanin